MFTDTLDTLTRVPDDELATFPLPPKFVSLAKAHFDLPGWDGTAKHFVALAELTGLMEPVPDAQRRPEKPFVVKMAEATGLSQEEVVRVQDDLIAAGLIRQATPDEIECE